MAELREHALVIGEVTLTSGRTAQYYVDAKRAILRPEGFAALATLLAAEVRAARRERRGRHDHGGRRGRLRGARGRRPGERVLRAQGGQVARPAAADRGTHAGGDERCLVVEDVVTTGGSTLAAIAALKEARARGLRRW